MYSPWSLYSDYYSHYITVAWFVLNFIAGLNVLSRGSVPLTKNGQKWSPRSLWHGRGKLEWLQNSFRQCPKQRQGAFWFVSFWIVFFFFNFFLGRGVNKLWQSRKNLFCSEGLKRITFPGSRYKFKERRLRMKGLEEGREGVSRVFHYLHGQKRFVQDLP